MPCEGKSDPPETGAPLVFDKSAPRPTETEAEADLRPKARSGCGCLIHAPVGSDWVFGQRCPVEFHL